MLLESVARRYGARAIAIILSGTGADGSRGVRAIKAAGGYVIAQDPLDADIPSMPDAARDTGCVDQVLSPEQIGVRLRTLTRAGDSQPWRAATTYFFRDGTCI